MWNKSNDEVIKRIEILNNQDFIYATSRNNKYNINGDIIYMRGNFYMVYLCKSYHGSTDTETIVYHVMGNEINDLVEKFDNILFNQIFSISVYNRENKLNLLGI